MQMYFHKRKHTKGEGVLKNKVGILKIAILTFLNTPIGSSKGPKKVKNDLNLQLVIGFDGF